MPGDSSGEELQSDMIESFANKVLWPFMGQWYQISTLKHDHLGMCQVMVAFYSQAAKRTAEDVLQQVQKTEKLLNKKGPFLAI